MHDASPAIFLINPARKRFFPPGARLLGDDSSGGSSFAYRYIRSPAPVKTFKRLHIVPNAAFIYMQHCTPYILPYVVHSALCCTLCTLVGVFLTSRQQAQCGAIHVLGRQQKV